MNQVEIAFHVSSSSTNDDAFIYAQECKDTQHTCRSTSVGITRAGVRVLQHGTCRGTSTCIFRCSRCFSVERLNCKITLWIEEAAMDVSEFAYFWGSLEFPALAGGAYVVTPARWRSRVITCFPRSLFA